MRRLFGGLSALVVAVLIATPVLAGDGWRHRHHGHHGHGHHYAWVGAAFAGGLLLGHLLTPRYYHPPPPAPVAYVPRWRNCIQTTGTGTLEGRPALYEGTMCYDFAGRAYIIRGSERFVGYLE